MRNSRAKQVSWVEDVSLFHGLIYKNYNRADQGNRGYAE